MSSLPQSPHYQYQTPVKSRYSPDGAENSNPQRSEPHQARPSSSSTKSDDGSRNSRYLSYRSALNDSVGKTKPSDDEERHRRIAAAVMMDSDSEDEAELRRQLSSRLKRNEAGKAATDDSSPETEVRTPVPETREDYIRQVESMIATNTVILRSHQSRSNCDMNASDLTYSVASSLSGHTGPRTPLSMQTYNAEIDSPSMSSPMQLNHDGTIVYGVNFPNQDGHSPSKEDVKAENSEEKEETVPGKERNKSTRCFWYFVLIGGFMLLVAIALALTFLLRNRNSSNNNKSTDAALAETGSAGIDPEIAALVPSFVPAVSPVPSPNNIFDRETSRPTVKPSFRPTSSPSKPPSQSPTKGALTVITESPTMSPSVSLSTTSPPSGSPSTSSPPSDTPTSPPTLGPIQQELFDLISPLSSDRGASMLLENTPQRQALDWLSASDPEDLASWNTDRRLQRYALATLYYSLNGTDWDWNDRWLEHHDECKWANNIGKNACDKDSVLYALDLSEFELRGRLAPEIGLLTNLALLDLSRNQISGPLVSELVQLQRLRQLNLQSNRLEGNLPAWLRLLNASAEIRLDDNDFEGPVPRAVCDAFAKTIPKFYVDCGGQAPAISCPPGTCCTYCCQESGNGLREDERCECVFAGSPLEDDVC